MYDPEYALNIVRRLGLGQTGHMVWIDQFGSLEHKFGSKQVTIVERAENGKHLCPTVLFEFSQVATGQQRAGRSTWIVPGFFSIGGR